MNKTAISTQNAPEALGPYSQGISAAGLLFISGQLPLDPESNTMIDGDIAERTRRILLNIEAIAKAGGAELTQVIKTTIFLTDLNDFSAVNEAYASFFPDNPPARSTVQVAALPLGSNIEIEAVVKL